MKYISIGDQLRKERAKNIKLKEQAERNAANVDYVAMMCDIELELETEDESREEASEVE